MFPEAAPRGRYLCVTERFNMCLHIAAQIVTYHNQHSSCEECLFGSRFRVFTSTRRRIAGFPDSSAHTYKDNACSSSDLPLHYYTCNSDKEVNHLALQLWHVQTRDWVDVTDVVVITLQHNDMTMTTPNW
eukprot:8113889-Pyramimonas_sp.AAC.1